MPAHDWTRVGAGIVHDFQLAWNCRIALALNSGSLPTDYYALVEPQMDDSETDRLSLQVARVAADAPPGREDFGPSVQLKAEPPATSQRAEAATSFYRRKQRVVAVRHVSGDDVVAMIEIVSPGNKDSRRALRQFVDKAAWLLERGIYLLILDLCPPTPRDPAGIHGAIWDEIAAGGFRPPEDRPLTLVAYEADGAVRAYIEPIAVGSDLPEMPLFLQPGGHVEVPLEATYREAFAAVPRRWRQVLGPG